MPGFFPHFLAGCAMFVIGRYYFKKYFDGNEKIRERLLLAVVCISFSFLPDIVLVFYYVTHYFSFGGLLPYHNFVHLLMIPIAVGALVIIRFFIDLKRKPIWIMGFWCILLHITMDLLIQETGIWF
jgi:hypothetical protein